MLRSDLPKIDCPLVHRFTPGLYAREIFMPAGSLASSKIHNTEHPFVVLTGKVSVRNERGEVDHIEAPYVGITKPGARRLIFVHEDCRWITFHPLVEGENGEEDLPKIEARILEKRLLPDGSWIYDHYRAVLRGKSLPEPAPALEPQYEYGGAP